MLHHFSTPHLILRKIEENLYSKKKKTYEINGKVPNGTPVHVPIYQIMFYFLLGLFSVVLNCLWRQLIKKYSCTYNLFVPEMKSVLKIYIIFYSILSTVQKKQQKKKIKENCLANFQFSHKVN